MKRIWSCCRQMDVLAADERMDDAQKAAFYAEIRDELVLLRKRRDLMAKKLQAFNELIDEVETRLKETEQYDRRKKKEGAHSAARADQRADRLPREAGSALRAGHDVL